MVFMNKDKIISYFQNDRYAKFSNIKIVDVDEGYCKVKMIIEDKHLNALDIVHGGAIFTAADFAFAVASNSRGIASVSINSSITFFRPPKTDTVYAEATEINNGKTLAYYKVNVYDSENNKIADFSGTVFRTNKKTDFK